MLLWGHLSLLCQETGMWQAESGPTSMNRWRNKTDQITGQTYVNDNVIASTTGAGLLFLFVCLFVLFCWGGLFSIIFISDSFRIGADEDSWFALHYWSHEANTNTSQLIYKYSRSASCLIMNKLLKKLNEGHMKWCNDAMNQGKYTCSSIPAPILHPRGSRFHFPR